jgi:uncharacterized membrane protein YfcA
MSGLELALLVVLGLCAGGFGALAGVGGGVIITPVLAMYFGLPMHHAIGISLVAVIATSTATSAVYVERHLADIRLGMTLELATTTGAAVAAVIAAGVNRTTLAMLFVCFLSYSAFTMIRRAWTSRKEKPVSEIPDYQPRRIPVGLGASLIAGTLSGLLGVGGGVLKVPIMYLFMGVPLRVATATSNFMIGVTAATSAWIYYGRGDVDVLYAAPLVVGVFAGSLLGARMAPRVKGIYILLLFIAVTVLLAVQMVINIAGGKL